MSVDNIGGCRTMIRRVNKDVSWHLTDAEQEFYAQRLQAYISEGCSDMELRRIVIYFHDDHAKVDVLLDHTHQDHEATWDMWIDQIQAILVKEHLDWSSDTALDHDNLAQVAQTELARSLPKFRYSSHFATVGRVNGLVARIA